MGHGGYVRIMMLGCYTDEGFGISARSKAATPHYLVYFGIQNR